MTTYEINVRRCELNVTLGKIAEQFATLKRQMIELELQEASVNREMAELALEEIGFAEASVSHGWERNGH